MVPATADPHALLLLDQTLPATRLDSDGWLAVLPLPPEAEQPATGHASGCACCVPRSGLALLLSDLFLQRARGEMGLFRSVLLVAPERRAPEVMAVARDDIMVSGRYRFDGFS